MSLIEEFIRDIDSAWHFQAAHRIRLRLIGSAALMLQTTYRRGTSDSDVLETVELTQEIKQSLCALAGRGTELHKRRRLYLDIVAPGFPFLPQVPVWHQLASLNSSLRHFAIDALDVVDVVVSKLKRFNPNDVSDISAMVERELVPHERLVARFRAAVDFFGADARAEDLPRYVRNLHRVERDDYGVDETEIELPTWI